MDLVGKVIAGRYEIIEEVGKGGMAYVYKARCNLLNRYVAVKVLKEELKDDKEFVHRFNTEAQAAARISNPHVVSIYDVGFENGLYYIVMEYVEGITLKEYIAEKHVLQWRQAAEFAAQICEGLAEAHKKSVIHRDIKPQNIIMTEDDVLKVTDFGIARATTQATTTTANSTIGTVHYLSPEQARGGYTNERTDIYSLGVVLYEMLTGRVPFDDNTAVAIAIKHIQEKPVLPRILNNSIPEAMEYIVLKAMNKEQAQRYASAEEFLKDLRTVIKNPKVGFDIDIPDFVTDDDDIGATKKRNVIDDKTIERYKEKTRTSEEEYEEYSKKLDDEMEESRLRSIDRKRAIREQKKKERRITITAIAAAFAVIVLMWFGFSRITDGIFGSGNEKIEIPNVVDMKLEDAQKRYRKDGFSIIATERVSDKPVGTIIEQNPEAGTDAIKRKDILINVIISSGSEQKKIGTYTGMKVDEARSLIVKDGFIVNVVDQESSSEEKDMVISQDPTPGTDATAGRHVTIYVSTGDGKEDKDEEKDNKPSDNTPSNNETQRPSNNETQTPSVSDGSNGGDNNSGTEGNGGNSDEQQGGETSTNNNQPAGGALEE